MSGYSLGPLPQHLDAPVRWVVFTWDEWVAFGLPAAVLGGVLGAVVMGLCVSLLCAVGVKTLKARVGVPLLWARVGWSLPGFFPGECLPCQAFVVLVG